MKRLRFLGTTAPTRSEPAQPGRARSERRLVDGVFQGFTSFETWDLGSSDFDRVAGLRVTTGASSALFDSKGAKTYQHHGVTSLEGASDGFDHCIQRAASNSFRDISRCGD